MAVAAIAGMVLLYFWVNPKAAQALSEWMSVPQNSTMVFVAIIVIAVAALYFSMRKKSKK
jgi:hypothetical protein